MRLTDIRKMRLGLEAMSPSPIPVKRGRSRPRKSQNQSPKITNFFSSSSPQSSGSQTPARGLRRTLEPGDKENQGAEEESRPSSLLKFGVSSGQDKKTEELVYDPEIDEEKDFNAAFDKVKKNVTSLMEGGTAVENVLTKVAVESSPSLSMDDVLQRLNQENTVDSEVEYVIKDVEESDKDELSADDEDDMEDLPTTSTAWSSITTLMMDSPQPLLVASPAKKKSPKKYQRSKRMSRLIDNEVTGTDTDDGPDTDTRAKRKPLVTAQVESEIIIDVPERIVSEPDHADRFVSQFTSFNIDIFSVFK